MNKIIIIISFLFAFGLFAQNLQIKPLSINTEYDDFSSQITKNGNEMFFTSDKDGKQAIYEAKWSGKSWFEHDKLSKSINSGDENGSVALTPDGQYMIFAAFNHDVQGNGRTDLYSARKIDGSWTDVQNLGVAINSEHWDSQPTLSSDGNTLYFVSDRPSSKSGTNIFQSSRTREGWTKATPVNSVNTDYDEMSPFIAADNTTFSFSSNKPGGNGGFDIYFSKLSGDNFTDSKNAGNIINTDKDEYFYVIKANSDVAFFSSSRNGGNGGLDIYTAIPNPYQADGVVIVSGKVLNAHSRKPLGTDIILTDLATGEETAYLSSDDEIGEYYVVLQAGKRYSITADEEGFVFYSEVFEIPSNIKENEIKKDIYLNPIGPGSTRLVVFFDFDKATLKNESKPELERIKRFLNKNTEVKIELHGHTDDQGTDEYNMQLSKDRALAVKNYLINGGIDSNRIETKGFGESKPLINETNDEARAKNRRVEMVIVN